MSRHRELGFTLLLLWEAGTFYPISQMRKKIQGRKGRGRIWTHIGQESKPHITAAVCQKVKDGSVRKGESCTEGGDSGAVRGCRGFS